MRIGLGRRKFARLLLAAAVLVLLGQGQVAYADGCLLAPAKLPDGAMQAFKDRPGEIMDRYPAGGPALSSEIMRRVGSDVSTLTAIINLAKGGNTAQRVAIGIGLAKAAVACSRTHPQFEQAIKQAVTDAANSELATAFIAGLSPLEQALPANDARPAGAPIGDGPRAGGGDSPAAKPGPGGVAAIVVGTELLTFSVQGSTISIRRGGRPAMSLRLGRLDLPDDTGAEPGTRPKDEPTTPPEPGTRPDKKQAVTPQPVTSLPGDLGLKTEEPQVFSSRGIQSTYGSTVSPTRR